MTTKLCIDCKHFRPNITDWDTELRQDRYARCALTAKVDGRDGEYCSDRRKWSLFGKCGLSGKQWEPK